MRAPLMLVPFVGWLAALAVGDACASDSGEPVTTRVIQVGPQRALTRVADAARIARDGDTIEIDAGEYDDDVASWPQSGITLRGVGGYARMNAAHASAQGKGTWVISGDAVVVENVEFTGARVADRNGAGIRFEGLGLTVRHCRFHDNEMGLLTWNDPRAELTVEDSEFHDNAVAGEHQPGDPIGHQVYVGSIARFTLRDSRVWHGRVGHLVKSRASESRVIDNRLLDGAGGRASYELEFPNGGVAIVRGNVIGQSADTENLTLVSFGAEGYRWPRNELLLIGNTLVDRTRAAGVLLYVRPGAARVEAVDNLTYGPGRLDCVVTTRCVANFRARAADFAAPETDDFRLRRRSRLAGKGVSPDPSAPGSRRGALNPGAMQPLAP